jgi:tripartite-type tricarboxylate transporter receptor subunit TctC
VEPGSSYDLSARALARHIGKYIPGQPNVVVQNVPGAGSFTLANQLYALGPKDGTSIGAIITGVVTAKLLRPKNVLFDPSKFSWIGSINKDTQVLIVSDVSPVQSLDDLRSKELIVAATTLGTANTDFPLILRDLFGFRFRIVAGYADWVLALERGEVQGNGGAGWSGINMQNAQLFESGKLRVIGQYGAKRHPQLQNVPMVAELARNEDDKRALELVFVRQEFGRSFIGSPDVPPERVEALRRAFDATMADAEFRSEADRTRLEVDPSTGEELAKLAAHIATTPPDVVARVRKALEAPLVEETKR